MDRVDSSGSDLDLDIDLESGGTSEEDAGKGHVLSGNLKNLMGRINNEFLRVESPHGSTNSSDCSCSYEKLLNSDEISIKNKETQLGKFGEEMVNFVDKTKERSKKQTSAKPPRPPRGPSLDASDMKLLKEISELNMKRKRMERTRTLRKMKKEKASSLTSNLFALLVTIVFLLVIVFHGLLGSRM